TSASTLAFGAKTSALSQEWHGRDKTIASVYGSHPGHAIGRYICAGKIRLVRSHGRRRLISRRRAFPSFSAPSGRNRWEDGEPVLSEPRPLGSGFTRRSRHG